ncbi:hypothetical protein [Tolypothrix sp. FACHB-123]|uniref:hypothetical protein n=1 Tax=Tolypothrix sp. FACHB-123 TaxID=2692868 RepID=UPI001F54BF28|nr:hypothetical protein [Tolypothrix sp. FACHB-123]
MPLRTRGSAAVDKAQRRLALLKSIDKNLDLGHGLTIEAYSRLIDNTRAALESHNTLLSNLEESRNTVTQMDKALSELSERMLSGIASVYGKKSMEYSKAGGSSRKRGKTAALPVPVVVETPEFQPVPTALISKPTNGRVKN